MPEWTPSQRRAIASDAGTIICSAAAGSGKTAVMIERIIRFLRQGISPEDFLVVTFTNAAAAEMREKIRRRLQQEKNHPVIREILDRVDLMQVSTIHSFCQQLLRDQFQRADLDPNFQICDAALGDRLFHEAFVEACSDMAGEEEELYRLMRERFEPSRAEKLISSLHPFLMSIADPFGWLEKKIDAIPDEKDESHPWFATLREMAADQLRLAELRLGAMFRMLSEAGALESYQETWRSDAELFHVKQSEIRMIAAECKKAEFARLKAVRGLTVQESDWKDRYQKIREEYKKLILRADELLMTDPSGALLEWKNMRESLIGLQHLLVRTEEGFSRRKMARGLLDFQDLEQQAVKVLSDPAGLEEAHSVWRYIFVDECQDTSHVQNTIINLLKSPDTHLFMVGDVKQSIYRFRQADPIQFLDRIRRCREHADPDSECVTLQENFRSTPEILDTVNLVFRSVMKEGAGEIEYGPEEEMIPGRRPGPGEPVCVAMIQKKEDESDLEAQADFLRAEIHDLLLEDYPGENRKYMYRDIVILMPAVKNEGTVLSSLLEKRGIPVFFDGEGEYYQLREIRLIRNLLEWIDNPLQDLPLIAVLQESPFFFREEDLAAIRLKAPGRDIPFCEAFLHCAEENSELGRRCAAVWKKMRDWQDLADILRVPELIWTLYHETGLYYILGAEPTGKISQANLRMLAQRAAEAETRGILTLRDFLRYMRDDEAYGDQQAATLLGEQDNLVRIMTIHKSKGLQFPVVFCAGMDKTPWGKDQGGIRIHAELGLCVDYKDPTHRISRPTLADSLFAWRKQREEMAEKIRLLYVAMTRAQERLYLMTCQETNPLWSMPEGEGRILSAKSYTDWWMPVFLQENHEKVSTGYTQRAKPYEIRVYETNTQETVEKGGDFHSLSSWLESVLSAPVVEKLWKNDPLDQKDPVLKKRSVTSLIRSARVRLGKEEEKEEENAEIKRTPDALSRKSALQEMPEMPAFMKEQGKITAAWRGTLIHRMLSVMDLEGLRRGKDPLEVLREEKERMLREHMATEAELKVIDDAQIARFWSSEMGKRMLRAPEIQREWNFNLHVQREGEEMLLQGVIDCAFREEGGWVVLDYKTDRGKTAEEMAEEYRPQIQWYCRAVEELTGEPVKEAGLYSLSLECLIPLRTASPEGGGRQASGNASP